MLFPALTQNQLKDFSGLTGKSLRRASGHFLIEGVRLFREFLKSDFTAAWIVIENGFERQHSDMHQLLIKKYFNITYHATEKQIRKLSDTEEPQGIVAAVVKPKISRENLLNKDKEELILALDRISDPGNLGTIIRCADWFGVRKIALNNGCVEAYNPKVIRGTMGSVFRVQCFEQTDFTSFFAQAKKKRYEIWGTSSGVNAAPFPSSTPMPNILLIGSEAHGIGDELLLHCDRLIKIPRFGQAESLNAAVACGILLNDIKRSSVHI